MSESGGRIVLDRALYKQIKAMDKAKMSDFLSNIYGNTAQSTPDGFAHVLLASFPSYRTEIP